MYWKNLVNYNYFGSCPRSGNFPHKFLGVWLSSPYYSCFPFALPQQYGEFPAFVLILTGRHEVLLNIWSDSYLRVILKRENNSVEIEQGSWEGLMCKKWPTAWTRLLYPDWGRYRRRPHFKRANEQYPWGGRRLMSVLGTCTRTQSTSWRSLADCSSCTAPTRIPHICRLAMLTRHYYAQAYPSIWPKMRPIDSEWQSKGIRLCTRHRTDSEWECLAKLLLAQHSGGSCPPASGEIGWPSHARRAESRYQDHRGKRGHASH